MTTIYRRLLVGSAIIIGIVNAGSIASANTRITNSPANIGAITPAIDIKPIQQRATICQIAINCNDLVPCLECSTQINNTQINIEIVQRIGINRAEISKIPSISSAQIIRPGIVCADIESDVMDARIPIVG